MSSHLEPENEKVVHDNNGHDNNGHGAASAGERRKATLVELDEASFSWFHAKACIVAGE